MGTSIANTLRQRPTVKANGLISVSCVLLLILFGCGRTIDSYCRNAIALSHSGNIDGAIRELEKAAKSGPPSAKVFYGLGALYADKGLIDKALASFNKGVEMDSDYRCSPDPNQVVILEHLNQFSTSVLGGPRIFTEDEITRRTYCAKSIEYIWQHINYKKAGRQITGGCASDEEKILALFDWTYRNISLMPADMKISHALPMDIMLRGYGLCDRSAWVFVALAEQAGYHGNIFGLRNPETLESPHTVALIFLNGKWVVFDTYNGIVFKKEDGRTLAELDDIINNPALTHIHPWYQESGGRCFAKGLIQIPIEAEAGLPRMKLIQNTLDEFLPDPPNVYQNLHEDITFNIKSFLDYAPSDRVVLPAKAPGKPYEVILWFYPFFLRWHYAQGIFKEELNECDPAVNYYQTARQSFLLGRYDESLSRYDALLKTSPDSDYSDDMEYFRCLCYFGARKYSDAIPALEQYLKTRPCTKWATGAIYHLARSYEAAGLYPKALEEYKKIEALPNVQQRVKSIGAITNFK